MNGSLKNLLRSELFSAVGYLERLILALSTNSSFEHHPKVKEMVRESYLKLMSESAESLFKSAPVIVPEDFNLRSYKIKINASVKLIDGLLEFGVYPEGTLQFIVSFINLIYQSSHTLHQFVSSQMGLGIEFPRLNLIRSHLSDSEKNSIPTFELPLESLIELASDDNAIVHGIHHNREKRYEKMIEQGHQSILAKNVFKGLDFFVKANELIECAESLTLIAFASSLLGQLEKAKSFALKAIEKDPDYGPAYNDLGTYLMQEGRLDEAIKWFNLAKRATHYNNREYPFINCGRAFVAKKDFERALLEFNHALTLAPSHSELHTTIARVKDLILKDKQQAHTPMN